VVSISGSNNDIVLTGGCAAVIISGSNNDIHAELLPGASITISGSNSEVYFKLTGPGPAPAITTNGSNNHATQVR
jgi:hypothetical protein